MTNLIQRIKRVRLRKWTTSPKKVYEQRKISKLEQHSVEPMYQFEAEKSVFREIDMDAE